MRRISFAVLMACFLLGVVPLAAADKPIVGSWDCAATTGEGEIKVVLTVKEQGGKLTGVLSMEGDDRDLIDPKFENDVFTFRILLDSVPYDVQVKVAGSKLDGSWKGGGESGQIRGSKK